MKSIIKVLLYTAGAVLVFCLTALLIVAYTAGFLISFLVFDLIGNVVLVICGGSPRFFSKVFFGYRPKKMKIRKVV